MTYAVCYFRLIEAGFDCFSAEIKRFVDACGSRNPLVSEDVGKVDNAVARPQTTPSVIAALAGPLWPSESFSGSSEIINSREKMRFWNHLWRRIATTAAASGCEGSLCSSDTNIQDQLSAIHLNTGSSSSNAESGLSHFGRHSGQRAGVGIALKNSE
jgi:hypothetical protein